MEAKHMKKVSQAYHGINMGKIFQKIIQAATIGETDIQVETEILSSTAEKYFIDLGYKIEDTATSSTKSISWG
jgi:hypothetical protein